MTAVNWRIAWAGISAIFYIYEKTVLTERAAFKRERENCIPEREREREIFLVCL
jgi:hypothetical protein